MELNSGLLLSKNFTASRWEKVFRNLFAGRIDQKEAKKILLLLARKSEEAPEMLGCLRALRQIEPVHQMALPFLTDICGTGGDGAQTFNVSTVSAFVIAGAGAYVAKHGNRAISSKTGSSDLMEALGVKIKAPFSVMLQALRKTRFGYFHAPLYHPSFLKLQPLRRSLGVRTLFNAVGPLTNPFKLSSQTIGVSHAKWLEPMAETLKQMKRKRVAVFRSGEGLDELSTCETSDILYVEDGRITRFRLKPWKLGFKKARKGDYAGGGLRTNEKIALQILENRLRGPCEDIVLLNSAVALWIAGLATSIEEGVERSRWSLRTGRARKVLEGLRRLTQT